MQANAFVITFVFQTSWRNKFLVPSLSPCTLAGCAQLATNYRDEWGGISWISNACATCADNSMRNEWTSSAVVRQNDGFGGIAASRWKNVWVIDEITSYHDPTLASCWCTHHWVKTLKVVDCFFFFVFQKKIKNETRNIVLQTSGNLLVVPNWQPAFLGETPPRPFTATAPKRESSLGVLVDRHLVNG